MNEHLKRRVKMTQRKDTLIVPNLELVKESTNTEGAYLALYDNDIDNLSNSFISLDSLQDLEEQIIEYADSIDLPEFVIYKLVPVKKVELVSTPRLNTLATFNNETY